MTSEMDCPHAIKDVRTYGGYITKCDCITGCPYKKEITRTGRGVIGECTKIFNYKNELKYKYIIVQKENRDLHAQWDGDTILFDSLDEADEFVETFPEFFGDIECGIVPVDMELSEFSYIQYKELIEMESFKEEFEYTTN